MDDNNDGKNKKNKEEWNKKYTLIAIYSFIVILASFAAILIILGVRDFFVEQQYLKFFKILTPIIYGFVFAYLLNPLLMFFQNKVYYKLKKKIKNTLAIISAYFTMTVIITLILLMIIPQVILSVQQLTGRATDWLSPYGNSETSKNDQTDENNENDQNIEEADDYNKTEIPEADNQTDENDSEYAETDNANSKIAVYLTDLGASIQDYIDGMGLKIDVEETFNNMTDDILNLFSSYIISVINGIFSVLYGIFSGVLNFILGILLSVYLLIGKDKFIAQVKKIFFAFLPARFSYKVVGVMRKTHEIFGGFIIGKILESAIVGVICFIVMVIFRINYAVLISVIVAVTNVIPFFGAIIGGVIGAIFLSINDIRQALLFAVIILILQQIDANFIGPKILGSKVGLPAFWVIVSIIITGGIFGVPGVFFGVPIFAVAYVLIKEYIENKLEHKGFPAETENYIRSPGSISMESINYKKNNAKKPENEGKSDFFGKALHKTAKNIMGIFHSSKNTKNPENKKNDSDPENK
ncbi:MAG: AI-2E family transporter [Oscillospiraceae bacterium]|nr:AI-2E family transporter [Oscillospiraceae bacterium]